MCISNNKWYMTNRLLQSRQKKTLAEGGMARVERAVSGEMKSLG